MRVGQSLIPAFAKSGFSIMNSSGMFDRAEDSIMFVRTLKYIDGASDKRQGSIEGFPLLKLIPLNLLCSDEFYEKIFSV